MMYDDAPTPGWYLEVDPAGHRERLDKFIARRLPRVSRNRASRLSVTDLDQPQRRFKKSSKLHINQRLWIQRPLPAEDLSRLHAPSIIFSDEHMF